MNYKGRYMKGRFATWCIWNAAAIKVWFALRERENLKMKLGYFLLSAIHAYPEELYNYSGIAFQFQAGYLNEFFFDAQVSVRPSKKISLNLRTPLRLPGIHYHHENLVSNITILIGRAPRIADFWWKRTRSARNKLGLWDNYLTSPSTYQTKSRIKWISPR